MTSVAVRPARATDALAVAALLVEGFGHEYSGAMARPGGRRMLERIHALPGRMRGIWVAVNDEDAPVGMAGLQTGELRAVATWGDEHIMIEELGIWRATWFEFVADLVEPFPYQPRADEALVYSVVVTADWRGQGVGAALLAALHTEALRLHKRRVVLQVIATNTPAVRLYERLGYVVSKRRRGVLAWLPFGVPSRLLMEYVLR